MIGGDGLDRPVFTVAGGGVGSSVLLLAVGPPVVFG